MSDLTNTYDNEPVHYCDNCLSISIKELRHSNIHVCTDCGNTHFEETHIDTWIEMYNRRYGRPFLSYDDKILEE